MVIVVVAVDWLFAFGMVKNGMQNAAKRRPTIKIR